jgi:hypothetical protein
VPDLLHRIRRELDDRIAALRPVADECARLQRAADALDALNAGAPASPSAGSAAPARRAAAPPRGRTGVTRTGGRRAKRSTSGRAAPGQTQLRVIDELQSHPGSTSTAVAAAVGISANAAAATISRLVKQGRVSRLETGGYATGDAPAAAAAPAPAASAPPDHSA